MMRKTLLLLALLSLGCGDKPPAEPVVLGLLAPRSGPQQQVGLDMERGVQLAIEEAKDQPVHNRPVEVLVVDTAGSADTAFHQAVRLVSLNRVAALIGAPDAESAEKLCRVGETYQLPALTLAWLPPSGLGPFGFSVTTTPADRGKALAQFAVQASQPVAVLTDSRDATAPVLAAAFAAQHKKIVFQELFGKEDVASVAKRALASKPEAVLVTGPADLLPTWRKELPLPILFGGPLQDGTSGVQDVWWTTPFAHTDPAAKVFVAKFDSKFGVAPSVTAALAYDAARLWMESARKAELPQGVKVRDELRKWTDFPSVTGPLVIDGDQAARRLVYVLHGEAGTVRVVGSMTEQAGKR